MEPVMKHTPATDIQTIRAPAEYFTGTVWQERINAAPAPARAVTLRVTFEPGGRTNWHTHPFGQTLYVVSGVGRFQTWGEPIREIRAGDAIWIPPGEKHWHGASPTHAMCHMAIQEAQDGKTADWLEPVDDATAKASVA
jgi:quercetin dioxygenase-like cupin family protein